MGASGDGGLSPWARPLAALPRMAKAWEIESKEGEARSSSRESKQMGSVGDWGGLLATGVAAAEGVDRGVHIIGSLALALGVETIFFFVV